jgi:hypothetical protein
VSALVPVRRLVKWRRLLAEAAVDAGAPAFIDLPDEWYEHPHWFCGNGHVSHCCLSGDLGQRCLSCQEPVVLGPRMSETAFAPVLEMLRGAE